MTKRNIKITPFTELWCFYSIVSQVGGVIPRIEKAESKINKIENLEFKIEVLSTMINQVRPF